MYGSGAVSWIQTMSNKWIKRENSYIHIFKLQTELNMHKLVNFFVLRDNQFTSVGLQSTIVLYTQEHSNTPCRGIKNLKKKNWKKYPWKLSQRRNKSTEQIFFRFQLNLIKNLNISSSRSNFNGHLRCGKLGQRYVYFISKHTRIWRTPLFCGSDHRNCVL